MHPRWRLDISGPDGNEIGDLRFEGAGGRILLQHDDKAFQPLQDLKIGNGRISFTLSRRHLRYEGTVSDSRLQGTIRGTDGSTWDWDAAPLSPKVLIWPIAPRVIFRQLAMGSAATSVRLSSAWFAGAPDSTVLDREYGELAVSGGIPAARADRGARSNMFALGLDNAGRAAARTVLERIGRGAAADPEFRAIFTRDGRWKLDIHDAMLWEAPHYLYGFQLARAGDALRALHELNADVVDSQAIRQAAWRLWSASGSDDSVRILASIDTLGRRDEPAANTLRALLAGFNDSTDWWRRALSWLLTHPWLETPDGPRSPAQMMAAFWGVDSLPLPRIEATRFGGVAAMPTLSIWHVAPWLIRPDNASAAEWLPRWGVAEAFSIWRPLRWGETPLTVVIGDRSATVASPGSQAIVHPSSFFGERDAIRIDPGIMPLAALAAFLHEWNHLIATQRRLAGMHPAAVVPSATQLQLREEDPWLAEGFAEWATDEVLRPAGASAALLRFTQSEKRLGIAASDPDDPHFLGFRLVRAALHTHRPAALRDLLVLNLHDVNAFARAAGLPAIGGARTITLQRPATAIVIPEVTFTWVEGTAFDLSRRLVIPNTRSEH